MDGPSKRCRPGLGHHATTPAPCRTMGHGRGVAGVCTWGEAGTARPRVRSEVCFFIAHGCSPLIRLLAPRGVRHFVCFFLSTEPHTQPDLVCNVGFCFLLNRRGGRSGAGGRWCLACFHRINRGQLSLLTAAHCRFDYWGKDQRSAPRGQARFPNAFSCVLYLHIFPGAQRPCPLGGARLGWCDL